MLRGHQGQSLGRAVVEVRERLARHRGVLQQRARACTEELRQREARLTAVEHEREAVEKQVAQAVAELREAATCKEEELTARVTAWGEEREEAVDTIMRPIEAELERTVGALERLRALAAEEDDVRPVPAPCPASATSPDSAQQRRDVCFEQDTLLASFYDQDAWATEGASEAAVPAASTTPASPSTEHAPWYGGGSAGSARRGDAEATRLVARVETRVDKVIADWRVLPRIEAAAAVRACAALSFNGGTAESAPGVDIGTPHASWRERDGRGEGGAAVRPGDYMTDAMELDRVAVIALGNTEMSMLSPNDRRLFWKHRVTLTDNKRALLKLLKCAQWDQERQVRQLLELVPRWVDAPVEDALEMLGANFMHAPIRALAVRSLRGTPDAELLCYLMPLTMALRYDVSDEPHLADFLLERALANGEVAIALHWYLTTERSSGGQHVQLYTGMMARLMGALQEQQTVLREGEAGAQVHEIIRRQESFVAAVGGLMAEAKRYKEPRPKQIERLMAVLADGGAYSHLTSLATPVHLPHQPSIEIAGVVPDHSTILKSALNPVKLTVRTTGGVTRAVLFKQSNDLRRDQLILSCIDMMDMLLQREGVDLRITTYKVTATSADGGLVEWVEECFPLSEVLAQHDNDIRIFFRKCAQDDDKVLHSILDNFVKSCAGFCVVSFLLGIGDRHLDNLMLSTNGRLFHVDFEYILGNDPKPFAPPMKLSEQMVVAMGGRGSRDYLDFHKFCCKAYLILRKSAKLFVALLDLVEDLQLSTRSGVSHGALIADRFQLDLSREEAVQYMQGKIHESLGALFPQVVDVAHRWRLYFKT